MSEIWLHFHTFFSSYIFWTFTVSRIHLCVPAVDQMSPVPRWSLRWQCTVLYSYSDQRSQSKCQYIHLVCLWNVGSQLYLWRGSGSLTSGEVLNLCVWNLTRSRCGPQSWWSDPTLFVQCRYKSTAPPKRQQIALQLSSGLANNNRTLPKLPVKHQNIPLHPYTLYQRNKVKLHNFSPKGCWL